MQEEEILQQIGLTEKEARVYLSCLQLGQSSILELAQKAGLKRPHVYNVVESLSTLGLLSKTKENGKTLYLAEDPKNLKVLLKQREEKIEKILPSLEAFYNVPRACLPARQGTIPNIQLFTNKNQLDDYKKILNLPDNNQPILKFSQDSLYFSTDISEYIIIIKSKDLVNKFSHYL